jgi:hypothetical protein
MSLPGKFLLGGLLIKAPERRLGAKRGIQEVKEHPWCEDCDWNRYLQRNVSPPYIPDIRKRDWIHTIPNIDNKEACPVLPVVKVPPKQECKGRLKTLVTDSEAWPDSTTGGSRICTIETPKMLYTGDSPRRFLEENKHPIEGDLDDDPMPEELDGKGEYMRHEIPMSPLTKKGPGYHSHMHTCLTTPLSKDKNKLGRTTTNVSLSPYKTATRAKMAGTGNKKESVGKRTGNEKKESGLGRFIKARLGNSTVLKARGENASNKRSAKGRKDSKK